MIAFYDYRQTSEAEVKAVVDHPNLRTVAWPLGGLDCKGKGTNKWDDPQRAMMLSGFVYVPGLFVNTSHWLKLDTDVVATGCDDWIDPKWFEGSPAIVSHRWTFTKPPDSMLKMDRWVDENILDMPISIARTKPLNLVPKKGSDRLGHKRIISWCGFFDTKWTCQMAELTYKGDRRFELPIPSQDGFLWYLATRMGRKVVRANMNGDRGWAHWSTMKNVKRASKEAMDSP